MISELTGSFSGKPCGSCRVICSLSHARLRGYYLLSNPFFSRLLSLFCSFFFYFQHVVVRPTDRCLLQEKISFEINPSRWISSKMQQAHQGRCNGDAESACDTSESHFLSLASQLDRIHVLLSITSTVRNSGGFRTVRSSTIWI